MAEEFYWNGSKDADAIAPILSRDGLGTILLALRIVASRSEVGAYEEFAIMYRRLGGTADIDVERLMHARYRR